MHENTKKVLQILQKRNARHKLKELSELTKLTPKQVESAIAEIRESKNNLVFAKFDKTYYFSTVPTWYQNQTDLSRKMPLKGAMGFISDTHLGSVAERLDLVKYAYQMFEKAGVKHVFHCGDMTDGWQEYRGHINYVKVFGDSPQAIRVIKSYPKVPGITTYVIAGN